MPSSLGPWAARFSSRHNGRYPSFNSMALTDLHLLSASEAARLIRDGIISSEQLVDSCLARIREVDAQVQAWTFLDPDYALAQARALDELRLSGQAIGPLHGVPVGVKDIFDTADMPTENGSVIHAGRTPSRDATAVSRLRAAGAVIMGKTVTTEFAYFSPGKTRNPHNPEHTPGGSSSGSAAAVGSGMIPLALGSQTNGSTIRPAAYCGIVGFKPTHGLISRHRVSALSRTLDHVGLFARTVDDIALLCRTASRLRRSRSGHTAAREYSFRNYYARRAATGTDVCAGENPDVGARRQ